MRAITLPLSVLLLVACSGRGGETGEVHDDYTDSSDPGDDTGSGEVEGFLVEGAAVNLMDPSASADAGLCVHAADPTNAISGGAIEIIASGSVADDGSYSVAGIETTSAVGLLMLVEDCNDEGTVMPTATGIAAASYTGLGTGDAISERAVYSIDGDTLQGIAAGLAAAGYAGDLEVDGALIGFVFASEGVPADGATVAGPDGYPTYYLQADGSWSEDSTVAATGATFVIPAAPIYNYIASADGLSFDALLAGSQPGYAVVVSFTATE
jgi:hypothetical protein